jgi:Laminin G domain
MKESPKSRLRAALSDLYNTSSDNIDIFTVLKNDLDSDVLDVRFSAHGSPYYEPEKLNGKISQYQHTIEEKLDMKMLMVNIDECLIERAKCESSCMNVLEKSNVPISVFTNRTSFVGVNAFVTAHCGCAERPGGEPVCYNGGTTYANTCECPKGFEGPSCEQISVGFSGNSWALYPPMDPCESTKISLELKPQTFDGLVMYIGPMRYNHRLPVQDFLALELHNGHPVLTVDYGTGAVRIQHNYTRLETGRLHTIDIYLTKTGIEMVVDQCKLSVCVSIGTPLGKNEFLNVNSPIHLGGSSVNLESLGSDFGWTHVPSMRGYIGCIRNLTINEQTYNLGQASIAQNIDPGCENSLTAAVTFGVANNFIYALIACIVLLLILILAVVVHKKSYDGVSLSRSSLLQSD